MSAGLGSCACAALCNSVCLPLSTCRGRHTKLATGTSAESLGKGRRDGARSMLRPPARRCGSGSSRFHAHLMMPIMVVLQAHNSQRQAQRRSSFCCPLNRGCWPGGLKRGWLISQPLSACGCRVPVLTALRGGTHDGQASQLPAGRCSKDDLRRDGRGRAGHATRFGLHSKRLWCSGASPHPAHVSLACRGREDTVCAARAPVQCVRTPRRPPRKAPLQATVSAPACAKGASLALSRVQASAPCGQWSSHLLVLPVLDPSLRRATAPRLLRHTSTWRAPCRRPPPPCRASTPLRRNGQQGQSDPTDESCGDGPPAASRTVPLQCGGRTPRPPACPAEMRGRHSGTPFHTSPPPGSRPSSLRCASHRSPTRPHPFPGPAPPAAPPSIRPPSLVTVPRAGAAVRQPSASQLLAPSAPSRPRLTSLKRGRHGAAPVSSAACRHATATR